VLSELLYEGISCRTILSESANDFDVIHLIGSVIHTYHIEKGLEHSRTGSARPIAFWGCGMRDRDPIDPQILSRCVIAGVRGPLSRDLLGLPLDTPLGDPALLLPALIPELPSATVPGKIICVPHYLEKKTDDELQKLTGAEEVMRPQLPFSRSDTLLFISNIAGSKFVLAGSLHAAIVACAYGRPFAFFDSGYIDAPFKWEDLSASINIECKFAAHYEQAIDVYNSYEAQFRIPRLFPLAACCPIPPRAAFLSSVRQLDEARGHVVE
jgi:hypothetical protein